MHCLDGRDEAELVEEALPLVVSCLRRGKQTVERLGGKLIMADVITRPHAELMALLPAM